MKPIKSHLLTKEHDSLILGRGNDIGQHVNKSALNKLQSVAWSINENILHLLHDTLKDPEEPLSRYEEANRVNGYRLRDEETNETIDYLLENGNKFYFGFKYDMRGRSYSQGYHVNIQGNEYRKAMLSFANKEKLTERGKHWLAIDIANTYGFDKETWFKRKIEANKIINYVFYTNGCTMHTPSEIEQNIIDKSHSADSPLLFIKAMYAWWEGVVLDKPIGHNMGLDSTASGESPSLTGMLF